MIGSIIVLSILIILLIIGGIYKYPEVMQYLANALTPIIAFGIPSIALILVHLVLIKIDDHRIDNHRSRLKEQIEQIGNDVHARIEADRQSIKSDIDMARSQMDRIESIEDKNNKALEQIKKDVDARLKQLQKDSDDRIDKEVDAIGKTLDKKIESEIDKSKIRDFKNQTIKLDKATKEIEDIRKEFDARLKDSKSNHNKLLLIVDKYDKFMDWLIDNFKITKKQQMKIESEITEVKRLLGSGIKGEEWKKAKAKYDRLKEIQSKTKVMYRF